MSSTKTTPGATTKVVASKLMHENFTGLLSPQLAAWVKSHTKFWLRQVQYRIPRNKGSVEHLQLILDALKSHQLTGKPGKGLDRLYAELSEQTADLLKASEQSKEKLAGSKKKHLQLLKKTKKKTKKKASSKKKAASATDEPGASTPLADLVEESYDNAWDDDPMVVTDADDAEAPPQFSQTVVDGDIKVTLAKTTTANKKKSTDPVTFQGATAQPVPKGKLSDVTKKKLSLEQLAKEGLPQKKATTQSHEILAKIDGQPAAAETADHVKKLVLQTGEALVVNVEPPNHLVVNMATSSLMTVVCKPPQADDA